MKKLTSIVLALVLLLSLTACGGNESTSGTIPALNMPQVYSDITANVTMPEMIQVDSEMLLDLFGVKPEYCSQSLVYICANSLRADEIWLMEAKDADSLAALKQLVQSRLDQKDAESITYDPQQNAVVKAAEVIEAGNYLVMIVSPEAATIAANFRTLAGI